MALTINENAHPGLANNLPRLDKLVVFRPLRCEQLEEVLQIELRKVQSLVGRATYRPFLFRIIEEARQFLLAEGTDQRYGARHLNRVIERFLFIL